MTGNRHHVESDKHFFELYYVQHNQTYPGEHKTNGQTDITDITAALAFVRQLTEYTDINGNVSTKYNPVTARYGPYIKGGQLPINPFDESRTVTCDVTNTDLTVKASDGSSSWKFYVKTGILLANDDGTTNGMPHADL